MHINTPHTQIHIYTLTWITHIHKAHTKHTQIPHTYKHTTLTNTHTYTLTQTTHIQTYYTQTHAYTFTNTPYKNTPYTYDIYMNISHPQIHIYTHIFTNERQTPHTHTHKHITHITILYRLLSFKWYKIM